MCLYYVIYMHIIYYNGYYIKHFLKEMQQNQRFLAFSAWCRIVCLEIIIGN